MGVETRKKTIDGEEWTVTQMAASDALDLSTRIMPAMAQGIVPVVGRLLGSIQNEEAEAESISNSIESVFRAMPPKELSSLIRDLCTTPNLFRGGEPIQFEKDFSGGKGLALCYKVALFVLEANLSDFFESMLPDGARARAAAILAKRMETVGVDSTDGSGDPASQSLRSAG